MTPETKFTDSAGSVIEFCLHRERIGDAEFARLLRDIDELTAWFRARQARSDQTLNGARAVMAEVKARAAALRLSTGIGHQSASGIASLG